MSVIGTLVVRIAAEMAKYKADLGEAANATEQAAGKMAGATGRATTATKQLGNAAGESGDQLSYMKEKAVSLGQALAGVFSAHKMVQTADAVTVLKNQLVLATGGAEAAARAYHGLFDIAQRSRVSFTELGGTFASISRAGDALGLSQRRLLGVTEAISNAVAVSGGSADSARASLVQLSQGLASGTLRGDELNSVMEQTPRLARALADGLGVTTGELRQMGEQGKITADAVINALESQSAVLKGELSGSIVTVGQAWTQLGNASVKAVGELDAATGVTQTLAGAIQGMAVSVTSVSDAFKGMESSGASLGAAVGGGLSVALETVAVLASDVVFVFKGMGREIGAISAQAVALAKLDIKGFRAISEAVTEDAERARKELDEFQARVLNGPQKLSFSVGDALAKRQGIGERYKPPVPSAADKAAIAAANKELEAQRELIAELSGLSGNFYEDWARLNTMFSKGKLSVSQLSDAQAELLSRQPAMRAEARLLEDAQKDAAKQSQEAATAYAKVIDAGEADTQRLREQVSAEAQRVAVLGLSTEALAEYTAAQYEDNAASLDRKALAYESNQLGYEQARQFREQAEELRKLAALKREGAAKSSAQDAELEAKKAAQKTVSEWQRAAEQIQGSITDALMRGFESGKGFAENLRDTVVNMFKTMVLRPVVEMGVRGGLSALGLGGVSGAANASGGGSAAGAAGSVGDAYSGLSMLSGMKGWLTDFGGGVASQVSKLGNYLTSFSSTTVQGWGEGLMNNATAIGEYAQTAGNALGYFNAALAASEGKWGKAIGTGIGTYFGGPIGAAIGGAIGGWVDEAFGGGHEYTTGTGISGRFSGSDFAGRNYQDWRNDGSSGFLGIGGSGSSSGTNYSAMETALQKSLGAAYGSVLTQTAGFATALGANATSIIGYQKDIKLSLGTDAEANKKAIAAMFKGIADEVAATVLDSRFMREGEGAADTLARLATNLTAVNGALDTLGDNLLTVGQNSGDIASSLVDAFGGLQSYQSAISAYYQRFYSQEERLAKTREQVAKQMADLGLSVPDSTEAFRALVNAQDLSSEAGRKTYAALVGMSSAFADITDAAQAAQLKLSDVAKSLATLLQSVTSARESVAGARNQVNPAPVMDADGIRAAVLAATTNANTAAMNTAANDLGQKTLAATNADAALKNAEAAYPATRKLVGQIDAATELAGWARAQRDAAAAAYATTPRYVQVHEVYTNEWGAQAGRDPWVWNTAGLAGALSAAEVADRMYQTALSNYADVRSFVKDASAAAPYVRTTAWGEKILDEAALRTQPLANVTAAANAKIAADSAAAAAQIAYTKAIDAWAAEASKSVPQLTKLRDETLRYYEAQKALAEGMATSAANLRAAVASTRASQLDPLASAQLQQRDFAKNYALALSTSGAVQAGYADKLAAALPTLSEALKATRSTGEWTSTMARLFAQSNAIADQLDASAPKDYQAESLGLLDNIDSALTVLDDSTRAITRAIEASGGVTAAGLRAVVSTLGGVPSFDVGTNYVPHDMFARIHEGEAIVPKVYNPFRPGSTGAGLGDTARLEAIVERQTQQLEALRAELRAITIHTANTAENTRSMDKNGVLVFNDPQAPIETRVVPA